MAWVRNFGFIEELQFGKTCSKYTFPNRKGYKKYTFPKFIKLN